MVGREGSVGLCRQFEGKEFKVGKVGTNVFGRCGVGMVWVPYGASGRQFLDPSEDTASGGR
jgi:hypothetical protein